MGAELPPASVRLLRAARSRRTDVKVLSDSNAVFIRHVLAGARLQGCVDELITNGAAFERVVTAANDAVGIGAERIEVESMDATPSAAAAAAADNNNGAPPQAPSAAAAAAAAGSAAAAAAAAPSSPSSPRRSASSQKLVIVPRRSDPAACPRCPANLCKGEEVAAIRDSGAYARIVFAGDGANDICAACALGGGDVVLARDGHALAGYAAAAAAGAAAALAAEVHTWRDHEELAALVEKFTVAQPGSGLVKQ